MEENKTEILDGETAPAVLDEEVDEEQDENIENDASLENGLEVSEREEYERLIKKRFKELYAEDTQRLINRRFRKYKIMEERYKILEDTLVQKEEALEESLKKIEGFEAFMCSEIEKAIKETEERVIGEMRSKRMRPAENGVSKGNFGNAQRVTELTREERARLAKRAADGEKIKL